MQDAEADQNAPVLNKRKTRESAGQKSYAEAESSEEEDKPLVRHALRHFCLRSPIVTLFAVVVFNG